MPFFNSPSAWETAYRGNPPALPPGPDSNPIVSEAIMPAGDTTAETSLAVGDGFEAYLKFIMVGTREAGDTPDDLVDKACARFLAGNVTARVNAELVNRGQDGRITVDRIVPDYLNSTVQLDADDPEGPYVTVVAFCTVYGRCTKNAIPLLIWAVAGILAVVAADAVLERYAGWGLVDATVKAIKKVVAGSIESVIDPVKDAILPLGVALAGGLVLFLILGR